MGQNQGAGVKHFKSLIKRYYRSRILKQNTYDPAIFIVAIFLPKEMIKGAHKDLARNSSKHLKLFTLQRFTSK